VAARDHKFRHENRIVLEHSVFFHLNAACALCDHPHGIASTKQFSFRLLVFHRPMNPGEVNIETVTFLAVPVAVVKHQLLPEATYCVLLSEAYNASKFSMRRSTILQFSN